MKVYSTAANIHNFHWQLIQAISWTMF